MEKYMAIIWLAAFVLFALAEAASVSLVSLWFMGGALVAFATCLLGGPIWLQILLFFLVSIALLCCLRPLVRKKLNPRLMKTNADSAIGKEAVVTEAIDNLNAKGQVKLDGMYWTARSESGEDIPEGAVVIVRKIEGVKAIVALEQKAPVSL